MLHKTIISKPFQSLFILVLLLTVSCTKERSIAGAYVNEHGSEIRIDCNHRFHSSEPLYFPFLPENGDEISLATSKLNEAEFELWYEVDGLQSPFGIWNKSNDQIIIMGETYSRKPKEDCACNSERLYSANFK